MPLSLYHERRRHHLSSVPKAFSSVAGFYTQPKPGFRLEGTYSVEDLSVSRNSQSDQRLTLGLGGRASGVTHGTHDS